MVYVLRVLDHCGLLKNMTKNMKAFFVAVLYFSRQIFGEHEDYVEIPGNFSIGAGSSAYQVEGAWNVSDKSESIWDRRLHTNASFYGKGDHGDIAIDSYHKYKEDVQIVKNIGLNHYRFSISWSRVLPTGSPDEMSKDGIQYYKNLIDELLANGIEPFVTIHHFDDVQSLVDKTGGWVNESMTDYFADYARVLFRELGSRVKYWTTFNELNVHCIFITERDELGKHAYVDRYRCGHNLLKAHARAYHIYNEEFRPLQGGQIGVSVLARNDIPVPADDSETRQIAFDYFIGWIAHPIFSKQGDYPQVMKQRIAENSEAEGLSRSRLPEFSAEEVEYIRGTSDYLGINHYVSRKTSQVPKTNGRWYDDSGLKATVDPKWPITDTRYTIVPEGIGHLLRQIRDSYDNPPVRVLENGLSEASQFNDTARISYLYSFMKQVLLAVRDGCDVRSYTVWSLFDSFEWYRGNSPKFGLVHVDLNDPHRTRTPKLSSYWLAQVIREGILIPLSSWLETRLNMKNTDSV